MRRPPDPCTSCTTAVLAAGRPRSLPARKGQRAQKVVEVKVDRPERSETYEADQYGCDRGLAPLGEADLLQC